MATHYKPHIVTDGLVLYLDAANSKSYVSGSTTWYDLTNNNNNAIFQDNVVFDGNSIIFNNNSALISDSSLLNPYLDSFTISIWMKTTDTTGYVISKGLNVLNTGYYFQLLNGGWGGNCIFWFQDDTIDNGSYSYAGYDALDGQWHNITGVLNHSINDKIYGYSDGVLKMTHVARATGSISNNYPLQIGSSSFIGSISII